MLTPEGQCARCGQCCGAEGSPYQDHPFPSDWWPESEEPAWRRWGQDDLNEVYPILMLLGVTRLAEGQLGPESTVGSRKYRGQHYYYVWQPGLGPVKDTSSGHDGSSCSLECPFLMDDPGDGSRPCALDGTQDDGAKRGLCELQAGMRFTEQQADEWALFHPACSFVFVEE